MVQVLIEPDGEKLEVRKANTVLQLLNQLKLRPTRALVIREGRLLTPDLPLSPGDSLVVRKVGSRG